MEDLKVAPAVHFNFPLQSFFSTLLLKVGLLLPASLFLWNRGGLVNVALYCTTQNYTVLQWTIIHYTVLHCNVLNCTVLHFTVQHHTQSWQYGWRYRGSRFIGLHPSSPWPSHSLLPASYLLNIMDLSLHGFLSLLCKTKCRLGPALMFVLLSDLQSSCFTKQALDCILPPWAEVLTPTGRCAELKADWGRLYNVGGNEGSATQLFQENELFHEPGLTLYCLCALSLSLTASADRQLARTNVKCWWWSEIGNSCFTSNNKPS